MELGYPDCIVSGIPDSLSCIPESEAQGSGFSNQRAKISRIPVLLHDPQGKRVAGKAVV